MAVEGIVALGQKAKSTNNPVPARPFPPPVVFDEVRDDENVRGHADARVRVRTGRRDSVLSNHPSGTLPGLLLHSRA